MRRLTFRGIWTSQEAAFERFLYLSGRPEKGAAINTDRHFN